MRNGQGRVGTREAVQVLHHGREPEPVLRGGGRSLVGRRVEEPFCWIIRRRCEKSSWCRTGMMGLPGIFRPLAPPVLRAVDHVSQSSRTVTDFVSHAANRPACRSVANRQDWTCGVFRGESGLHWI